jgi:peptidoglycan L-alanyl-D-glutamate endopeptidase CwlK
MSALLFPQDILFLQRLLRSAGCYEGVCSGEWDAATDEAEREFLASCDKLAAIEGAFDPRSEQSIRSLHPKAQEHARRFLSRVRASGLDVRIISGTRGYEEQNALYRRGRYGNPGPRVTNARGGQSNHNFGIAWDIGIFDRGRYLSDSPDYDRISGIGLSDGLEWGGNWPSFPDRPHYQLPTSLPIKIVRERFESGTAFV